MVWFSSEQQGATEMSSPSKEAPTPWWTPFQSQVHSHSSNSDSPVQPKDKPFKLKKKNSDIVISLYGDSNDSESYGLSEDSYDQAIDDAEGREPMSTARLEDENICSSAEERDIITRPEILYDMTTESFGRDQGEEVQAYFDVKASTDKSARVEPPQIIPSPASSIKEAIKTESFDGEQGEEVQADFEANESRDQSVGVDPLQTIPSSASSIIETRDSHVEADEEPPLPKTGKTVKKKVLQSFNKERTAIFAKGVSKSVSHHLNLKSLKLSKRREAASSDKLLLEMDQVRDLPPDKSEEVGDEASDKDSHDQAIDDSKGRELTSIAHLEDEQNASSPAEEREVITRPEALYEMTTLSFGRDQGEEVQAYLHAKASTDQSARVKTTTVSLDGEQGEEVQADFEANESRDQSVGVDPLQTIPSSASSIIETRDSHVEAGEEPPLPKTSKTLKKKVLQSFNKEQTAIFAKGVSKAVSRHLNLKSLKLSKRRKVASSDEILTEMDQARDLPPNKSEEVSEEASEKVACFTLDTKTKTTKDGIEISRNNPSRDELSSADQSESEHNFDLIATKSSSVFTREPERKEEICMPPFFKRENSMSSAEMDLETKDDLVSEDKAELNPKDASPAMEAISGPSTELGSVPTPNDTESRVESNDPSNSYLWITLAACCSLSFLFAPSVELDMSEPAQEQDEERRLLLDGNDTSEPTQEAVEETRSLLGGNEKTSASAPLTDSSPQSFGDNQISEESRRLKRQTLKEKIRNLKKVNGKGSPEFALEEKPILRVQVEQEPDASDITTDPSEVNDDAASVDESRQIEKNVLSHPCLPAMDSIEYETPSEEQPPCISPEESLVRNHSETRSVATELSDDDRLLPPAVEREMADNDAREAACAAARELSSTGVIVPPPASTRFIATVSDDSDSWWTEDGQESFDSSPWFIPFSPFKCSTESGASRDFENAYSLSLSFAESEFSRAESDFSLSMAESEPSLAESQQSIPEFDGSIECSSYISSAVDDSVSAPDVESEMIVEQIVTKGEDPVATHAVQQVDTQELEAPVHAERKDTQPVESKETEATTPMCMDRSDEIPCDSSEPGVMEEQDICKASSDVDTQAAVTPYVDRGRVRVFSKAMSKAVSSSIQRRASKLKSKRAERRKKIILINSGLSVDDDLPCITEASESSNASSSSVSEVQIASSKSETEAKNETVLQNITSFVGNDAANGEVEFYII